MTLPGPVLNLGGHFFGHLELPTNWLSEIRSLATKGPLVYVLRNVSVVDRLALEYLVKRHGLPAIGFANGLPEGTVAAQALRTLQYVRPRPAEHAQLQGALDRGDSIALFLKRRPQIRDIVGGASGGRGLKEGDRLLEALRDLQRKTDAPIQLVPLVFVWTQRSDTKGTQRLDVVLGAREWPSTLRATGQLLGNYKSSELRMGAPLSLNDYLASQKECEPDTQVRRLIYLLLRRLERERLSITGPASIPPDLQRQRVLRSPQLQKTIKRMAGERPEDRTALNKRVDEILLEMQAMPNATAISSAGILLERAFRRLHSSVDIDLNGLDQLKECAKEGSLVLLPSHKSHLDYLVLSYLFNRHHLGLPLIAAGDNLSFFPVGALARRAGAFFIRRSFKGDRLYAAAVEAYIRRIMRDGHTLEVYLEGGRSRTGKLLPPQLGLLNILVNAALTMNKKPVFFAPISIGYERLIEASSFQDEVMGADKQQEGAAALLRTPRIVSEHYGRIDVQFGTPITLTQIRQELELPTSGVLPAPKRRAVVTRLANRTMDEINKVSEVTPGALVATSLLGACEQGISDSHLMARARILLKVLQIRKARIHARLVWGDLLNEGAVREALQLFSSAGLVHIVQPSSLDKDPGASGSELPTIYRVVREKRAQLDAIKNHIVHFFVEQGIAATAALMGQLPVAMDVAKQRVADLSRLFKYEFRFRSGVSQDALFANVLADMEAAGELSVTGTHIDMGAQDQKPGQESPLELYHSVLRTFIEGYVAAARALRFLLKGPMGTKEWKKKALQQDKLRLDSAHRLRPEAISGPLFDNALKAFREEGYIQLHKDRVELAQSCCDSAAHRALVRRIEIYLAPSLSPQPTHT